MAGSAYAAAGVDIDAATRAVEMMKAAVRATHTPAVLADVGSFGGLFALTDLPANPVLVASTDGVGTKVKLAAQLGRWQGIGHDIVNHCANDILVQGARPLFFLDYIATSQIVPEQVAAAVTGVAEACRAIGCVLLGGETAEMPGVYTPGAFDLAGTIVGVVGRDALLPRMDAMRAGDLLIGLPSTGPHTNGYSLIRKAIEGRDLSQPFDESGLSLADALLVPHKAYVAEVGALQKAGVAVKGLAHITGGGFLDNVPRILPAALSARIHRASWEVPPLFRKLVEWSGIDDTEAYRVWNMGMGMVVVVGADVADAMRRVLPESVVMGELIGSDGGPAVKLR
ncbi:MAG: phosphoribosylformylglycinamidine cyclo-ligase [Chloroflexi bacterium]|nr:MAG: phosphoribosylformylglycinamidine cyclo-ligase [Chloroflexota bacterium]